METTEKIVELLETGRIPWQKGWDGKIGAQLVGLPINGKTNRPYTRLNKMFLSMVMAEKESEDPRFFIMAMLRQQNKIHQEKVEICKATGKKYPAELEWEYRVKKGSYSYAVFSHWKVDKDRHGSLLPPEDQYWAKKFLETGRILWQKGWDGKIGAQLVGLPSVIYSFNLYSYTSLVITIYASTVACHASYHVSTS